MPKFIVTAPTGQEFEVEAPDGATQEDALQYAQRQFGGSTLRGAGTEGIPDDRGDFEKGFASGVDNMQGMTYGFAALIGDTIGHEGLTQWGLENYQRNQKEAAASAPRVASFRQIEGVGDFFDYAQGVLGQTAPFSATTIAGGGVGALLARAVAPRLIAKKIGEETAKQAVERILKDGAAKKVLEKGVVKWMKGGAMAGSFAASAATQQGGLYSELKEAGVDDAVMPAWLYGAGMGALDVAPEAMLAKTLLSPKNVTKELSKSITRGVVAKQAAKTTVKQTIAEGLTEGAQEGLAIAARLQSDEDFNWDDKANERILDNIVAGAVAGLFMGGAGAGIEALRTKRETKTDDTKGRSAGQPPATGAAGATPPPAGGSGVSGAAPDLGTGNAGASVGGGLQPAPVPEGPGAGVGEQAPPVAEASTPTAEPAAPAPAVEPAAPAAAPAAPAAAAPVAPPKYDRFGGTIPPEIQARAQEWLRNPPPMDARFTSQTETEADPDAPSFDELPPHEAPAAPAAPVTVTNNRIEIPAAEPTATEQDNSAPQSARRLAAELSDLANKGTPRKGVYVSANSLKHAPVAARVKAMKRGGQYQVVENADGKGGVLIAKHDVVRDFVARKARGEDPEVMFGEYTGAGVVTPTKPTTQNPVAVQRKNEAGDVVQETVVDGDQPAQVQQAAEQMTRSEGADITVTTPQAAIAERVAEVQQEAAHPWLALTKVSEMRDFLAQDPPFLGDPNAWSEEEAGAYEDEAILFLSWLNGKLPGVKKPSSHVRKAYETWHAERFKDRAVSDVAFEFDPSLADDLPVDSTDTLPDRFNADHKMLIRSVVDHISQWNVDEQTRMEVVHQLLTNPKIFNSVLAADRRSATDRQMAIEVISAVKGDAAVRSFLEDNTGSGLDSAAGSVDPSELNERDESEPILLGQDNVIDSVRIHRSKKARERGIAEESSAKPWKDKSAAELVMRWWKKFDKTMDYWVHYIDESTYKKLGLSEMPKGGAGYYVTAVPTFDAETFYSTLVGKNVGLAQLVNIMLTRAKRHYHDVLPTKAKEHPSYQYGVSATNSAGKRSTLSSTVITTLGYVYDPSLRELRAKNRAKANLYAFLTGVSLIETSGADIRLTYSTTQKDLRVRENVRPGTDLSLFAPTTRPLRGIQMPGNIVIEHRKGDRPKTLAHIIAEAMFTRDELQKVAAEALAKTKPSMSEEQVYKFVEGAKVAYIRAHFKERYAQALQQTQTLLELGVATPRTDRAGTMRTVALAEKLAEMESRIERWERLVTSTKAKASIDFVLSRITGLKARLGALQRREGAPGFDMREAAAEFSDLAREVAEIGGEEELREMLQVGNPDEMQGANVDNAENQYGQYMVQETEAAQLARSTAAGGFAQSSPFTKNGKGNSAMGTFAAPSVPGSNQSQAPTVLGNNPTVAPTQAPTSELNIEVELPAQEVATGKDGERIIRGTNGTVRRVLPAREASGGIRSPEPGKGITEASQQPAPPPEPTSSTAPTQQYTRPRGAYIDGVATRFQDSKRGVVARKLAVAIRKLLNLNSQLIVVDNTDAAIDFAYAHGMDVREVREQMRDRGQTGTVLRAPGVSLIYMNPSATDLWFLKSLAHEIGHVFYYETWSAANSVTRMRVTQAYEKWLTTDAGKRVLEKRPGYNIDEWIADQGAAWTVTSQKAVGVVAEFFQKLAVGLKAVYDYMQKYYGGLDETAAEFIEGAIAQRRSESANAGSTLDDAAVEAAPPAVDVKRFLQANNVATTISDQSASDLFAKRAAIDPTDPRKSVRVAAEFAAALALNHPTVRRLKLRLRQTQVYKNAKARGGSDNGGLQHALAVLIENDLLGRSEGYPESLLQLGQTLANHVRSGTEIVPGNRRPGTKRVDFAEALRFNPTGAAILKKVMRADPRFALAGSLAMAPQAAVYRDPAVMLHDIDFVFSGSAAEVTTVMSRVFPNAVLVYEFKSGATSDRTTTFLVPPEGHTVTNVERRTGGKLVIGYNVVNASGQVVGTFEKDADTGKETYTGERAYPVDVFTHGVTQEQVDNAVEYESEGEVYRLAPYQSAVRAKLKYSRLKDSLDYAAMQPADTLSPAFESLGVANRTAFDVAIDADSQQSPNRQAWNWLRGLRLKYPTLDKWATMIFDGAKAAHEKVLSRVFVRVERMNIPAFNQIMSHFHIKVGTDLLSAGRTAEIFSNAVDGYLARFSTDFRAIVDGLSDGEKLELMNEALREREIPEGFAHRQQLEALRALFARVRKYALKAGLPVREVTNYFTQVYDKEALLERGAADEIFNALRREGVTDPVTGQPYTLQQVTAMLEGMSDDSYAVDLDIAQDIEDSLGHRAPFAQALRSRVLPDAVRNVIRTIPDENGAPKYMSKSLENVVMTYLRQTVQRAEYNRRFGDTGYIEAHARWATGDPETRGPEPEFDPHLAFKAMLKQGVREGADQSQVDFMLDVMAANLGQYDRIENPNLRKLTNAMMLYQNLRTLLFVVFSSFPDMANIFIRTGEFKDTWAVMRQSMKTALKGGYAETLAMYGHAADAADGAIMRDMTNWRDADSQISRWNQRFFNAVQLTRWTNFVRSLGLKVSMEYIQKHARLAAEGNEDSQRRLSELGITPADVQEWIDGGQQSSYAVENATPATARVTAAIQQMVNDMVIHPTAPEKTMWGNSEQMKLLWHLKSFMYGFSTRVLGRAYHELTRSGAPNAQKLAMVGAVALLLPLAAFGLALRDLAQYWMWGEEARTAYDDPLKYMMTLAGRSGISGFAQLAVDPIQARQFGRAPVLAFAGPTVTWVNDWLEYPLHKTVPASIPIISSIPGIRNEIGLLLKPDDAAQ